MKDDDRGTLVIVDRAGTRLATSQPWEALNGVAWSPAADEVWFTAASGSGGSDYTIMALIPGQPERRVLSAPGGVILHDVAKDGKALVARYERAIRIEASLGSETSSRDLSWLGGSFARDIAPDGSRILLSYFGRGSSPNYDVYVRRTSDAEATRIGEGQPQQFSPDGQSVLAVIHGPPSRLAILSVGAGEPKTVNTGSVTVTQARWLDGNRLLVVGTEPGQGTRAYVTDVTGSPPRAVTPAGITHDVDQIALSFDRRRVAFQTSDGSDDGVLNDRWRGDTGSRIRSRRAPGQLDQRRHAAPGTLARHVAAADRDRPIDRRAGGREDVHPTEPDAAGSESVHRDAGRPVLRPQLPGAEDDALCRRGIEIVNARAVPLDRLCFDNAGR